MKIPLRLSAYLLSGVTALGVIFAVSHYSVSSASGTTDATIQNPVHMNAMHIKIDKATQSAKFTIQQAKQIADKFSPFNAKTAKNIIVEYHLVTDNAIHLLPPQELQLNQQVAKTGYVSNTPCYIVTYQGVTLPSKVPGVSPHHEDNIVIDANTGVVLFAFNYR